MGYGAVSRYSREAGGCDTGDGLGVVKIEDIRRMEDMKLRPRSFLALLLVAAVAGGAVGRRLYAQGSGTPRLTVAEALRLCTAGRSSHIGIVMVQGYPAKARVTLLQRPLQGLFPTQHAALSRTHAAPGLLPPSNAGIWLRSNRTFSSTRMITVNGTLDCVFGLPGMGDAGGTFAWLTVPKAKPASA